MVVGVSGGADSVALLLALVQWRGRHCDQSAAGETGRLIVAHVNHKLRGEESDRDEEFVRGLHRELCERGVQCDFRCVAADIEAAAQAAKENLEATARQFRYAWLAEVATEAGARFVVTGHTANDQAETVLFRLLRGTGLKGLRGVMSRRALKPGIDVIRPLLQVTRDEIVQFLGAERQSYCEDHTNMDRRYMRNRIRHELIPKLAREYNPAVVSVLGRLAKQAALVYRQRESRAVERLKEVELPRAGELSILDCRRLQQLPRHLIREILPVLWAREGWPLGRMGFREWERLVDVCVGDQPAVDLPDGLRARRRGNVVQVGRASYHSR
jgi:tRNA(Ile)-lysidine synthase